MAAFSGSADIAVIILTLNEAPNLPSALESVRAWAREVFVLDSHSQDATVDIARAGGATVVQRKFDGYANQRNFALQSLPIESQWVMFLDADEWVTAELKAEIREMILRDGPEAGWYIKRRVMWMGRWIRRGYYPTWILRLFRNGRVRCEDRTVNEHLVVDGPTGHLKSDFVHEDHKGIFDWIEKHNRYARLEASELINQVPRVEIAVSPFGGQASRKRWIRQRIWNHLPPLLRPFLYFGVRYILTGAFIEGKAAFIYHFMHALWYPMLIDAFYLEMRLISGPSK